MWKQCKLLGHWHWHWHLALALDCDILRLASNLNETCDGFLSGGSKTSVQYLLVAVTALN